MRRHDEGVVAGDGHATLGVFADLEQVEAALRLGQIRQGLEERLHVLLGGELEERLVEFLQVFGHLRQRAQRGKQITIGVHEPFGCLFVQLRGQGAQRAVDGEQLPCGIGVIEAFRHDAAVLDTLDKRLALGIGQGDLLLGAAVAIDLGRGVSGGTFARLPARPFDKRIRVIRRWAYRTGA